LASPRKIRREVDGMKTLILIRHAKSSWGDISVPDQERPLAGRGKRDAPEMGQRLARRGVKPDLILSSPALRARSTAEAIAEELDYKLKDLVIDDRLYGGGADELLEVIGELDDKVKSAILFGHNPGLTELAHRICNEIADLPTCAVAEFRLDAKSWPGIGQARLAKVELDYPRKLRKERSDQDSG
jgi:phosphohistidine phosphatase